jgi:hypothetical protein
MVINFNQSVFVGAQADLVKQLEHLNGVKEIHFDGEELEVLVTNQHNQFAKVAGRIARSIATATGEVVSLDISRLQSQHKRKERLIIPAS